MSLAEDLNPRLAIGANNPPSAAEILADKYAELIADAGKIADRVHSLPKKVIDDIALGRFGDVVKDARKLAKKFDETRSQEVDPHLTAQRETNSFFNVFIERLKGFGKELEQRATDFQVAKAAEERRDREEAARKAREEEDRQREIAEAAAAANRPAAVLRHEDRAEEAAERAQRLEVAAKASVADLTRVRSETGTVASTQTDWKFEIVEVGKIPLETLRPYFGIDVIEKAVSKYVRNMKGSGKLDGVRIYQGQKAIFR